MSAANQGLPLLNQPECIRLLESLDNSFLGRLTSLSKKQPKHDQITLYWPSTSAATTVTHPVDLSLNALQRLKKCSSMRWYGLLVAGANPRGNNDSTDWWLGCHSRSRLKRKSPFWLGSCNAAYEPGAQNLRYPPIPASVLRVLALGRSEKQGRSSCLALLKERLPREIFNSSSPPAKWSPNVRCGCI